jgi:copper resistance protein D
LDTAARYQGIGVYQWVVFVHIVAALAWIGGMVFVAVVLVPVLRRESPEVRAGLLDAAGRRFRSVGWAALIILLITGVWNLRNRGLPWSTILSGELFAGSLGRILLVKLLLVLVTLALSAVHDWVLGPAATRLAQQRSRDAQGRAVRLRRRASYVARLNALVALIIILLAVSLVRGLPW